MRVFGSFSTLLVSIASIALSNNDGDCGKSSLGDCCADFYKDPSSEKCLPCLGSYGVNCSRPCPSGYYGHGCRQKCHCDSDQVCDSKSGCSIPNNQTTTVNVNPNGKACPDASDCRQKCNCNNTKDCDLKIECNTTKRDTYLEASTLETVYILGPPFAGIFVLTLLFGTAFYCIKRKRRERCKHGQPINNNPPKVIPVIIHHTVDASSQNCTATQATLNSTTQVTYTRNEQTGSNGRPTGSPVNKQDTLESLVHEQYNSGPIENHHSQVGASATLPVNLMVSSPGPTPTTAAVQSAIYTSMTLDARQMNNTKEGDSQFCRNASFETLEKFEVSRPYSSVKYS